MNTLPNTPSNNNTRLKQQPGSDAMSKRKEYMKTLINTTVSSEGNPQENPLSSIEIKKMNPTYLCKNEMAGERWSWKSIGQKIWPGPALVSALKDYIFLIFLLLFSSRKKVMGEAPLPLIATTVSPLKVVSFLLISGLLVGPLQAGETTYNSHKTKPEITAGLTLRINDITIQDELNNPGEYVSTRIPKVRLRYSRQLLTDIDGGSGTGSVYYWDYTISYKIYPKDNPGNFELGTLTVSAAGSSPIYEAMVQHPNLNEADVVLEVTGVTANNEANGAVATPSTSTDIPDDIHLELLLERQTYNLLNTDVSVAALEVPTIDFTYSNANDNTKGLVAWRFVEGAEAYDLEYVFIDAEDHALDSANWTNETAFDYKKPTRVRTPWNHFDLDMVYPEGKLYFRVRALGRHIDSTVNGDYSHQKEGAWGYLQPNGSSWALYAIASGSSDVYEKDKNWQFVSTFAEDGKHKAVVSVHDGSLRNRQTLTNLSTDNITLIAESKYDSEGRPVVSILPAPRMGTSLNSLDYISGFNLENISGNPFEAAHFENEVNAALSNTAGAGNYYSSSNPGNYQFGNYTPTAGGYAYTQVQYMLDNTGRTVQASGVGNTHKLQTSSVLNTTATTASVHSTHNWFITPSSTMLHRLFGSNVGKAAHYKKIISRDPNGQFSAAYLDLEGRTIATALLGASPTNVEALESNVAETVVTNLNGNNNRDPKNGVLTSISHVFNEVPGVGKAFSFNYSMTGLIETFDDPNSTANLCLECEYLLTIRITDPDGILVPLEDGSSTALGNEYTSTITPGSTTCPETTYNGPALTIQPAGGNFTKVGDYTVYKELRVIGDLDAQIAAAFSTAGYDDLGTMKIAAANAVDATLCDDSCEDLCIAKADWYEATAATLPGDWYTTGRQAYIDACEDDCADEIPSTYTPCDYILEQMMVDVSPGGNHYSGTYTTDFWNRVAGGLDNTTGYQPITLTPTPTVTGSGATIVAYIQQSANWDEGWANDIVKAHREYCLYQNHCATANLCYRESDVQMAQVAHWTDALNSGWANPLGLTNTELDNMGAGSYSITNNTSVTTDGDDAFATCNTAGAALLKAKMTDVDGNGNSLYDLIGQQINFTTTNGIIPDVQQWYVFRGYYLALKEQVLTEQMAAMTPPCNYFNDDDAFFSEPVTYSNANDLNGALVNGGALVDCPSLCAVNVTTWIAQLRACNGFAALIDNNSQNYDNLVLGLTYFCENNCGESNPFGYVLSTETANLIDLFDPTNSANNFEDGDIYNFFDSPSTCIADILGQTAPYNGPCTPVTVTHYTIPTCLSVTMIDFLNGEVLPTANGLNSGSYNHILFESAYPGLEECWLGSSTLTINGLELDACSLPESGGYFLSHFTDGTTNFPLSQVKEILTMNIDVSGYVSNSKLKCLVVMDDLTNTQKTLWAVGDINLSSATGGSCVGLAESTKTLCLPNGLSESPPTPYEAPCEDLLKAQAEYWAEEAYKRIYDQFEEDYRKAYYAQCLPDGDAFYYTTEVREYNYTLYYYDQAGNLVQTVPPAGVQTIPLATGSGYFDAQGIFNHGAAASANLPNHDFITRYAYNSLNQPIEQETPDGGATQFWYNDKGQVVLSQNAEQKANPYVGTLQTYNRYSYTQYDAQERIVEVGELRAPNTYDLSTYTQDQLNYLFNNPAFPGAVVMNSTQIWSTYNKVEVTSTHYDQLLNPAIDWEFGLPQEAYHLRSRVATTSYEDDHDGNADTYDHATHYSYDAHGNVHTLLQEMPDLAPMGQDFKRAEYNYDLVSGNVNQLAYQPGEADQFYHRYSYDADNRITAAHTSVDGEIWDTDAEYFYYLHGPLARTEIGHDKVQGIDHAYTIQGWLKGANSGSLVATRDIGKDAAQTAQGGALSGVEGHNIYSGTDAFGYTLNYFNGDYAAAGTITPFETARTGNTELSDPVNDLYNGNISRMATAMMNEDEAFPLGHNIHGNQYRYDQLNRIKWMHVYKEDQSNLAIADSWANAPINDDYNLQGISYDGNGNITQLQRHGFGANQAMDNFSYTYLNDASGNPTNKLDFVDDAVIGSVLTTDLEAQTAGNYTYDKIGNLIADAGEDIANIDWTVYGKIKSITREAVAGVDASDLDFDYSADGNRVRKTVKPRTNGVLDNHEEWTESWYVRDAQGNILAVYDKAYSYLGDLPGPEKDATGYVTIALTEQNPTAGFITGVSVNGVFIINSVVLWQGSTSATAQALATAINSYTSTPNYTASASGSTVSIHAPVGSGAAHNNYPINWTSDPSTTFILNNVLPMGGGVSPGYNYTETLKLAEHPIYGSSRLGLRSSGNVVASHHFTAPARIATSPISEPKNTVVLVEATAKNDNFTRVMDQKSYELVNHLGNVITVVSDRKLGEDTDLDGDVDFYTADVTSYSDYYPFGMQMPGRNASTGDYRYGFNGKEKDKETYGEGNIYDYGFRIYNPRVAKFLSVDPLSPQFPWYTPYQFAGNTPIQAVDLDGLEISYATHYIADQIIEVIDDYGVEGNTRTGIVTTLNILKSTSQGADWGRHLGEAYKSIWDAWGSGYNIITGQGTREDGDNIGRVCIVYTLIEGKVAQYQRFEANEGDARAEVIGQLIGEGIVILISFKAAKTPTNAKAANIENSTASAKNLAPLESPVPTKNAPQGKPHQPGYHADDAIVTRGGQNKAASFENGSGVTRDANGALDGVSVNSRTGSTLPELTKKLPHNQVGVSTVGEVRAVGGDVIPSPTKNNKLHSTMSGVTAAEAESLMTPTTKNPHK